MPPPTPGTTSQDALVVIEGIRFSPFGFHSSIAPILKNPNDPEGSWTPPKWDFEVGPTTAGRTTSQDWKSEGEGEEEEGGRKVVE